MSLDTGVVASLVGQVRGIDAVLAEVISRRPDNFEYDLILNLIADKE